MLVLVVYVRINSCCLTLMAIASRLAPGFIAFFLFQKEFFNEKKYCQQYN